jgi:hypothetical protein
VFFPRSTLHIRAVITKSKIKVVQIAKYGPFWSVEVDNNLLCVCLYKRGAISAKELVEKLARCKPTPIPIFRRGEEEIPLSSKRETKREKAVAK